MAMDPLFSARYRMLGFLGITVSFAPLLFRIRIWLIARFRSEPLPTAYPVLMKQAAKVLSMLIRNLFSEYASRLEAVYPIFHGSFIQLTATYEDYLYGGKPIDGQQQLILHVAQQISQLKKINQVH